MDFGQAWLWFKSTFNWVDLLPVLLVVVACWGAKRAPKGDFFEEPLNKRQGLALRGVFACVVVFVHLAWWAPSDFFWFSRLAYWGQLVNAVFLGLSGYGVMVQLAKRKGYLADFWHRRLSALAWPYLVLSVLSALQIWRDDGSFAVRFQWQFGVVQNGWFCTALLVFYAAFWLVFRMSPWSRGINTAMVAALVGAATLVFATLSPSRAAVYSNGAFVAGLALGCWQHGFTGAFKRHGAVLAIIMVGIAGIFSFYRTYLWVAAFPGFRFLIGALFFVGIAGMGVKCRMGNRVLRWLGTISYELYLSHGWLMLEIRHWWPGFGGAGFAYAVVAGSLAMASALHWGVGAARRRWAGRAKE